MFPFDIDVIKLLLLFTVPLEKSPIILTKELKVTLDDILVLTAALSKVELAVKYVLTVKFEVLIEVALIEVALIEAALIEAALIEAALIKPVALMLSVPAVICTLPEELATVLYEELE